MNGRRTSVINARSPQNVELGADDVDREVLVAAVVVGKYSEITGIWITREATGRLSYH